MQEKRILMKKLLINFAGHYQQEDGGRQNNFHLAI